MREKAFSQFKSSKLQEIFGMSEWVSLFCMQYSLKNLRVCNEESYVILLRDFEVATCQTFYSAF